MILLKPLFHSLGYLLHLVKYAEINSAGAILQGGSILPRLDLQ